MHIYINGQEKSTLTVEHDSSKVVSIYPMDIIGLKINITLVATNQSTLRPILNGIEIFTRHDLTAQLTPPIGPYPSDTSKHFLSIYVILIHTICLVALFI